MTRHSDQAPRRKRMTRLNVTSSQQQDWGPMSQGYEDLLSLGGLTVDPGTLVRVLEPTDAEATAR